MQNAGAVVPQTVISELKVSAHLMTLDSGLFCLFQRPGPQAVTPESDGLPGVRVTIAPGADVDDSNITISGFRGDGWLSSHDDAALVRVRRGPAQIMVTIYQRPNGGEAPKLQVLRLSDQAASTNMHPTPAPKPAPVVSLPQPQRQVTTSSPRAPEVGAHIQMKGDVSVALGEWIGDRASGRWVEGFAIAPSSLIALEDIEYQAVLGRGWLSPWTEGGQFCGSRGMALPILGLRVRLRGAAANHYDCVYAATFVDGSSSGPAANGQPCESTSLAPLEAFQVVLQRRDQAAPQHYQQQQQPFDRR